ncbi:hypothetical protein [Burkholderia gladioli]|uniref:hypothetical protein n=1 Tax=Burkholderia gladioli TaxID=28095 RepID=UPI00164196B3|nr:hypothetical protein [Burkholderia gladioli]MDN7803078.1 hypothetical protein [Burkholderia gladioli]
MGKKLDAARVALQYAKDGVEEMKHAEDHGNFARAWIEILGHLTRVWNKTESALKGDPKFYNSPITKRVIEQRKTDELLVYLIQARNADEHGVESLTESRRGGYGISPANPGKPLIINSAKIRNGRLVEFDSPTEVSVKIIPPKTIALPVKNRGKIYVPPTSHLGSSVSDASLIDLATLGIIYYEQVFKELEAAGWDQ